ncbi:MAG: copper-binding protein [Candidimonas sp.]|jgi:Cu(I)/Ag(I) efflux system protein CusF
MSIFNQRVLGSAAMAIAAVAVPAHAAEEASASGEVRRVDAQAGKITIKHGAISDLGLPAMILVYQAAPDLLKGVQPGDKIKFTAKREAGQYVVTSITK